MAGLNQVLSLSDDLVRYLKACGKTSVLQTKPVNPTQLKGLKLAPDAIGNTVTISQKVVKNSCTDKLKLLFPQSTHQSLYKETRGLISELPLEHKMLGLRGGQRIAYPRCNYNGHCYTYTVNRFVHSPKGYTSELDDCIAVLLYNGDDAYLYHLAPNVHKSEIAISDMQRGISETIEMLGKGNKKCTAVLVGGDDAKDSVSLYKNISSVLGKHDMKPQEVLFAEGNKSIYYDIKKGILIIDDGFHSNMQALKTEYKIVNI